ncbi:hypothetical protein IFM53868_05101 [Aspergillus udagawae]|uniref:Uncharacterized protein n=1 Tax=Aspergillus udagawae TaxID=91492 RepID=A0ABQ1ASJ9_9EURO|nr:hypothetical protein IFM53868_05101 [Aspergillus udagawae]
MPPSRTCPAVLHIRDFIDQVEPDPTRPDKALALQLRISLNIPQKDALSDDVEQRDILTIVRFFCEPNRSHLYQPNAFIYAWGSFLTIQDQHLHIILHAHTIDRHPGDHNNADVYFMHCPEAAQPTVTFAGVVTERGGQLNNGPTLLHYHLQCTVYDTSSRSHHTFPITAYFKNGQRWSNVPSLALNTQLFITGRIFGQTKESPQLAVIADDIHFLPMIAQPLPLSPSSVTGKRKLNDRWARCATPTTPTNSTRLLQADLRQQDRTESQLTYHPLNDLNESTPPENDNNTQISWTDTADETESSALVNSPTPERRSQRARKTSYVNILTQSK